MHTQSQTPRTNTDAHMHSHVCMSPRVCTRMRATGMSARAAHARNCRPLPLNPPGLKCPSNQFDSLTVRTSVAPAGRSPSSIERKSTSVVAERGDIQTLS